MGCVCCSLSTFVSIVLQALERITLCTVCCLLVCCLLFTILSVMIMGIGIGFHYCTVQNNVDAMKKAAQVAGAVRSGPERMGQDQSMVKTVDKAIKQGFAHRVQRQRRSERDEDGTQGNLTTHLNTTNFNNIFLTNLTNTLTVTNNLKNKTESTYLTSTVKLFTSV